MKRSMLNTITSLRSVSNNLQGALGRSSNVESIIILDLLKAVREVLQRAEALSMAHTHDINDKEVAQD
jgi:hypothetical protein